MGPIVSVVVPTKNRYKYLIKLIELIESFNDPMIELVIQDNSDENTEVISYLGTKRLVSTKYYYTCEPLSMSQNADRAIKNSHGKYICFIGDDDAVCRNIVQCARWMEKNSIDSLRSLNLQFSWNEQVDGTCKGSLLYDDDISFRYRILDAQEELIKVLKKGVPSFLGIPKLYHGIVSREIIDRIYDLGGTCFPGVTPDMSNAVTLCFFVKKYAVIDIPVVLPGMSRMVGGGVMGKVLALEEVDFITEKDRREWEKGFPRLWATEIIWPDCAMKALCYVGHEEYLSFFNKNKMLSRLIAVHKKYFKIAYEHSDNKLFFLLELCRYFVMEGSSFFMRKKILPMITGKYGGRYRIKRDFRDIGQAEDFLMSITPLNCFPEE